MEFGGSSIKHTVSRRSITSLKRAGIRSTHTALSFTLVFFVCVCDAWNLHNIQSVYFLGYNLVFFRHDLVSEKQRASSVQSEHTHNTRIVAFIQVDLKIFYRLYDVCLKNIINNNFKSTTWIDYNFFRMRLAYRSENTIFVGQPSSSSLG